MWESIVEHFSSNWVSYVGWVLWGVSEVIAKSPKLKSNSVVQVVKALLTLVHSIGKKKQLEKKADEAKAVEQPKIEPPKSEDSKPDK